MKKVLGIALAIVMLLSCVPTAFAAVGANAACKLEIVPTADTYNNGDIVTFNVNLESDSELLGLMGSVQDMYIGFNGDAFEYIEDISSKPNFNECQTAVAVGYNVENNIVPANSFVADYSTSALTAADTAKGWNKVLRVSMTPIIPLVHDDDYSNGGTCFAFKLKVKDAAAAGTYTVGIVQNGKTIIEEEVGAINEDPDLAEELGVDSVFNFVDANVTVGSAAEASILQYSKAQIRFRGIGEDGGTYANEFDVRTIAKISQDDFLATFESEENAIAKISDIGFVYAATSKVENFDLDTAKAVAEGGSATNYVKKPVTRIQHTADGADYIFTCLIENIADADKTDGVSCLAYVCYDGEYIYFDAAATVSYAELYMLKP